MADVPNTPLLLNLERWTGHTVSSILQLNLFLLNNGNEFLECLYKLYGGDHSHSYTHFHPCSCHATTDIGLSH